MQVRINFKTHLFGKDLPTALIPWHLAPKPHLAHHDEILARDGHRVQEVYDAPVEFGMHHLPELFVQGLAERFGFRSIFELNYCTVHFTSCLHFPASSTLDSCGMGPSSRWRMR